MNTPIAPEPQVQTDNFNFGSSVGLLEIANNDPARPLSYTAEVINNYKFIRGKIVLTGKQPDGDSIAFMANDSRLYNGLYRSYLLPPGKRDGSPNTVQLRFEGIDTPELHYNGAWQPLAVEARNFLLDNILGFQSITYKPGGNAAEPPMTVQSNDPESIPVVIATNALETHGRPIAYILSDNNQIEDGSMMPLDPALLTNSVNYKMLEAGWAYLLSYNSMPMAHFSLFKQAANFARSNQSGVWQKDVTRQFVLTDKQSSEGAQSQLIYPKLFRRCIDYFKSGEAGLKEWFRKTTGENDLVRITEFTTVNISCLLNTVDDQVIFQADTNDIIFIEK